MKLIDKIKNRRIDVSVIGLGYTGLALAIQIAKEGICVKGIEINPTRVELASQGKSYITDVSSASIRDALDSGKFEVFSDYSPIKDSDVIVVCVPTPLNQNQEPDLGAVKKCLKDIRKYKLDDKLIILESTTYPGTTNEVVLPLLNNGSLAGKDFSLAYSPERVDPGNTDFNLKNTTRVVGGFSEDCGEAAAEFFNLFIDKVHKVSSPDVAEMTKLFENIFRCVNIALVNEMMLMCDRMDMNVWEVMKAAETKEFGFMPFRPGPGLGGHCIPIDPAYLSWKAKEYGFYSEFIELAAKRNASMPFYVFSKISDAMNELGKSVNRSKFLLVGVAYKKDVNDIRESPALKIIDLLKKKGGEVSYYDPYIEKVRLNGYRFESAKLSPEMIKENDCVIIVTDHTDIDYQNIVDNASLIVDTRNVLKEVESESIVRI